MRSVGAIGVLAASVLPIGAMFSLAAWAGTRSTAPTTTGSGSRDGVRVQISDDTLAARSGDVIDYTVRVENNSSTSYPHLEVFHQVPAGFQLVVSSPTATMAGSRVHWTADIPQGGSAVFTDQVMAGTVEESEHLRPQARTAASPALTHQFTSTACARTSGPGLACGTVREELTDGPDAAATAVGSATKHWRPGLLGIALVAGLCAVLRGAFRTRQESGEGA